MWLSGRWCTTCRTVQPFGRYGVSSWLSVSGATARRQVGRQRRDVADPGADLLRRRRVRRGMAPDGVLEIGSLTHTWSYSRKSTSC